jgi:iron complex outermembrane receptor protein
MKKLPLSTALLSSATILFGAGAAYAQDTATLDEIIVTAQKRSENLQNVPISIAAIGQEQLQRIDSLSAGDYARRVPGLSFRSRGPGDNDLVIRGVSSSATTSRRTTGYYLDETPVSAFGLGSTIDVGMFDLARIEVLRGPQGTLYGAGSMGGTIRMITNKPELGAFSGRADATVAFTEGGALSEGVNAMVNLPIGDKVALRAVGFARRDGGWIDNYKLVQTFNPYDPANFQADPNGGVRKNVNGQDTVGVRVQLALQPTEDLTITPSVFYQDTRQEDGLTQYDAPPGSADNQIQTRSLPENLKDKFTLYNGLVKYSNDAFDMVSSTSYFKRNRHDREDISVTPLFFFYGLQTSIVPTTYDQWTENTAFVQEVRLSNNGDSRLHYVVGAFYSDNTEQQHNLTLAPGIADIVPLPGLPADGVFVDQLAEVKTREKALFGELSYKITDTLTATIGLRAFQSENTTFTDRQGWAFSPDQKGPRSQGSKDNGVTPKFLVSWQATPDALIYGTVSQGFRPGGANPEVSAFCAADLAALGLTSLPKSFRPDTLWNHEIGAKTRWLDNRLTVNGAVYFIKWKDVQQNVDLPCGFSFFGNFGSAESKGAELEVTAKVSQGLTVSGGLAYNDAHLTAGGLPQLPGQAGDTLQNAPEWTANASIDYTAPITDTLTGGVTLNYQYVGEQYGSFEPSNPDRFREAYSMLQLNTRLSTDTYEVSFFVNNLTDEKAVNAYSGSKSLNVPGVRIVVPVRPRTFGIKLAAKF